MPPEPLESHVRRLRRRVRLLFVERYALFGVAAGAGAAAVLVVLSYRYDELAESVLWAGTVGLGAAVGLIFALFKRLDDLTVAKSADRRTGLRERLSSAVSLPTSNSPDAMEAALMSDATSHIASLPSNAVFRHRFGAPHIAFGAALLVLLAVSIVPQLPTFQSKTRRQEIAVMKQEGKKLTNVAKDIKKLAKPKQEDLRHLAAALDKLGRKMQAGRMDRKRAMLKTNRLSKQVEKAQDRLARQNARTKSMDQAQSEMSKASRELAKSIADKLAKQQNIKPEDALKQIPSDKRLAELARKADKLTPAERDELAKALEKYADPNNNLAMPVELAEALAKLAQNEDYQKAMEIMQKLAQKLGSGNMSKMDKEALRKQLEMLAKALKNTDLDQLAKMLREQAEKLAKMSPEELKKLAEQMKQMQMMAMALNKAGGT
ncbi:MAG: hypothetical protein Q7T82_15700 [Armatimonadota bacterium]|nr:hypothetical protein [Armatimonadota bacterium]